MLKSTLKILSRTALAVLITAVPVIGLCGQTDDFPYHLAGTLDKESVLPYPFDEVWDAALSVIRDSAEAARENTSARGIKTFMSGIKVMRESGLIIYTSSHSDRRGFVEMVLPEFTYQVLFIYPVEKMRTCIYSSRSVFVLYSGAMFDIEQNARQYYFVQPEDNMIKTIGEKLHAHTYAD